MESYSSSARRKVDLMITKIASFRRMCEVRELKLLKRGKSPGEVSGVIMWFERTIRRCFDLIDRDVREIAALKDVKVTISTDFGLASADTLDQVTAIYQSARNEAEKFVSKKGLSLIDADRLPVKVKKVGLGYYEENSPKWGLYDN